MQPLRGSFGAVLEFDLSLNLDHRIEWQLRNTESAASVAADLLTKDTDEEVGAAVGHKRVIMKAALGVDIAAHHDHFLHSVEVSAGRRLHLSDELHGTAFRCGLSIFDLQRATELANHELPIRIFGKLAGDVDHVADDGERCV
ncbi:endoribonuclease L-PSP, putative [Leishmania tarentolae]|uniref:Endoribonuclease L-PSP, putative n=1 Tax=Leishmania tarentolae TaxID=5689 RepID=A0A640KGI8_LEITA|nr:endoribonuclease L-PSP, putative [Leishmania tarentolae]